LLSEQPSPENSGSSSPQGDGALSSPGVSNDLHEYRLLVDHADEVLCRLTPQGVFVFVSPACLNVLGYEPAQLIGRTKRELVHPDDHHLIQPVPEASPSSSQASAIPVSDRHLSEYRIRRKEGRYIWAQVRSLIIRDEQGQPREKITSLRDITEHKQAQDNLRLSERLGSLGTLAAGIAHEINNPLGAILMAAHAAREFNQQQGQQAMVEEMIDQIMHDTRRGSQIVRGVLQFARQQPAEMKTVRLRELVLSARIHALRYLGDRVTGKKEVVIKVRGPDDSPWVHVGPVSIEQTLINLLYNAVDAGATRIQVQVRPMADVQRVMVQVIDDGSGMTSDQIAHAFDPFYTSRANTGNTGLGLSIAQGIVVAHGGKITLTSDVNRGTTVSFDLPMASPPDENESTDEMKEKDHA